VIAAEHYATQLVVAGGHRGFRQHWGSHKDQAIKALEKLAGPHVPASLKAIERAVRKADSDRERAVAAAKQQPDDPKVDGDTDTDIDVDAVEDERIDPET
jgi:hypothetical protein